MTVYYHAESGSFLKGPLSDQELEAAAVSGNDLVEMGEDELCAMVLKTWEGGSGIAEKHRARYREIMELAENGANGDSKHSKDFALSRIHGLAKDGNNSTI
jgi:hypothetical protein